MSRSVERDIQDAMVLEARDLMMRLTEEQRLEVMSEFCRHCGIKQPEDSVRGCQCGNDL